MSFHTIEEVSPTRRKFRITVPANEVQISWNKVVQEIQASAEVRGFRKGKAPLSLVKTVYANDIAKKVANTLVNDSYTQIAQESRLQIINKPEIEPEGQIHENIDFSFSATVDIYTPIEIKDYKNLSVTLSSKLSPAFEEEEVQTILKEECDHSETDHAHEHIPLSEERKQKIKSEMHVYFENMRAKNAFEQVIDQILSKNSFDVAKTLVESMIDQMIYNTQVGKNKKDPEQVHVRDIALRERFHDQALRQVKAVMALTQIAQQENIIVPFAEITKSVAYFLETARWNYQQIRENQSMLFQEHKNELTLLKTINFILEHANINWSEEPKDAK